jgi:hypothetical protein
MTVPLDVITRRKLILVRQIYQRALSQSEALHSDFDRIMSLIAFDLANETVLKAVVGALEPSKSTDKEFQGIIQQADALLLKKGLPEAPDKAKIQHVHSLRNDAQHKAKYPSANDVSDSRTYTRDFLQQITSDVWGLDFSSISLTEIIRHQQVREYLSKAEEELEKSEYTTAAIQAIAGFNYALNSVKASIVGYTHFSLEVSPEIYWSINSIKDVLVLPIIGLDYPSYTKYRQLTSHISVHYMADGTMDSNISGPEPSADEAAYIVNYAVNAAVQIESFVGDIDKPFGVERGLW